MTGNSVSTNAPRLCINGGDAAASTTKAEALGSRRTMTTTEKRSRMAYLTFFVEESRAFFAPSRLSAEVWMEVEVETVDGPQRKRFVTKVETIPSWTDKDAIESAFSSYKFDEWFSYDPLTLH
jgi:hypothetical protein